MRLHPILRAAVLGLGVLALAGCEVATGPARSVSPDRAVKVALLVPLGSEDPQTEALSQSLVNAAEMAQGDLSGVTLDLEVYGTAGDAAQAAEMAQGALADGAQIILGPLFSPAAAAVGPVAAGRGVQVIAFSNNPQIAGGNVFILGNSFGNTARRVVGYTLGNGFGNIGIVHPQGIEGEQARDAVNAAVSAAGGRVVTVADYPLSVQGITDTVSDTARQIRGTGANAVVLTDGPTGGLSYMAESLRGLGVRASAVRFVGLQRWDTSPQALAQPGLAGGWFAAPDQALAQQFTNRYTARYGTEPHPLAGLAYDGVAAIGALVAEARAEGRSDPFSRARITQSAGFAGVNGVFRFLPDGRNERALAVYEVVDGAAQQVDPAPRRFGAGGS